jgi:hypothetical protein
LPTLIDAPATGGAHLHSADRRKPLADPDMAIPISPADSTSGIAGSVQPPLGGGKRAKVLVAKREVVTQVATESAGGKWQPDRRQHGYRPVVTTSVTTEKAVTADEIRRQSSP